MVYCQELLSKAVKIAIIVQFLCLNSTYCLAQTKKEIQQKSGDISQESPMFNLDTTFAFIITSDSEDSNLSLSQKTNNIQANRQIPEKINLLQEILIRVNQIDDPYFKTLPLIDIAESYEQLNQIDKGTALIKEALSTSNQINNIQYKVWIMSRIAEVYGELNHPQKGMILLEQALSSINQIESSYTKVLLLSQLGKVYGELNHPKKSMILFQEAIETVNKIETVDQGFLQRNESFFLFIQCCIYICDRN